MSDREQFELGIAEFNRGEFFACHDTLEALWMEERGERRRFLQGLIQSAVGIFHSMSGNPRGAFSQLSRGLEKLAGLPEWYDGVHVDALRADLERLRDAIVAGESVGSFEFDPSLVPVIDYDASRGT